MRILLYLSRLLHRLFGWIAILLGVLIGLGAVSMFILSEATEGRVAAGALARLGRVARGQPAIASRDHARGDRASCARSGNDRGAVCGRRDLDDDLVHVAL
jgi:hypothetical protein